MTANPMIAERAERCRGALIAYPDFSLVSNLIDLLADAMHFCDLTGEDFHYALSIACKHYVAEVNGEQTEERRMP